MKWQGGAVLWLLLMLLGVGALAVFVTGLNRAALHLERDRITVAALAQAKEALIGYAAAYRDSRPDIGGNRDKLFGYLPCPDSGNDGEADSPCGAGDVSVIGHFPWKTLGLEPLRDGAGECLWYAVSGHAKNNPKTDEMNWDAVGQIEIREAVTNAVLVGAGGHDAPWAVVIAPRAAIKGQTRAYSAGACSGSLVSGDYLEGTVISSLAHASSTLTLGTAASALAGSNNDMGLWVTSGEIFERIRKRDDFADDIGGLLNKLKNELNGISKESLPSGLGAVLAHVSCPVIDDNSDQREAYVRCNWKNNLRYAAPPPPASLTVNGEACNALLFFGAARSASQSRATSAQQLLAANYLEGGNAMLFPNSGAYSGVSNFSRDNVSADVFRCIAGLPTGATQKSFASDFANFVAAGDGVSANPLARTLTFGGVTGTAGACFWYPDSVPLAGKTLRAYYDYRFSHANTYALSIDDSDRGNGFTFQMVRGDEGSPEGMCGLESNMGALPPGVLGGKSFIIETDVSKNSSKSDPKENHSAIMADGDLVHSTDNGKPTLDCNGSAAGCRHRPANKFEESPDPLRHNQRIEIHSGCDFSCANCDPARHEAPNTYARISVWFDCAACDDISVDLADADFITAAADRDFSAPGNWSGINWRVENGAFFHTEAGENMATLPDSALTRAPLAGSAYVVTLTVASTVSGKLHIELGGDSSVVMLAAGKTTTHVVVLSAISSGTLMLMPDAGWTGSIDNISIRRQRIQHCIALDMAMDMVYFGFTGGFNSGDTTKQEVTLQNFYLRSE